MKHKKRQIKKHTKELKKNAKKLEKKTRETVHIRISQKFYREIKDVKKEHGKTASFWIDEAWSWYKKQNNF